MDGSIDVNIGPVGSFEEYREVWKSVSRVRITCVEKNEECRHKVGDTFIYETPYKKPADVCPALLHVLDLYLWRATLGFPSWNEEDHSVYKLHCPDPKGTVWEMRKID
jgi:uncharacterized repeat protein (TIGR04076 family)